MTALRVALFGKMRVVGTEFQQEICGSAKARELLAYLLLQRGRAHPRERLGSLLWENVSTARSKAYLRKALWQLQNALQPFTGDKGTELIQVEGDWVRLDPTAEVWLDVEVFESAFRAVRDRPAAVLTADEAASLEAAVDLYTSDLLENWYVDWCLVARERLQDLYLIVLGKLVRYAERRENYDTGILYGLRMLSVDPARECAHRLLMRLRYLSGDRTGALRQYARCADVLDAEFGVRPSASTRRLHRQIERDALVPSPSSPDAPSVDDLPTSEPLILPAGGRVRIQELRTSLTRLQKRIRHELEAVDVAMDKRR